MLSKLLIIWCFSFSSFVNEEPYDFVVAKDGSGDFTTIQAALNAVPDFRKNRTVIFVKEGFYKEKVILAKSKTNVSLIGESLTGTVLTYDDFASKKNVFDENKGTSGSASFYVFGDGFVAENLTFENTAGQVGQAVALRTDADQLVFKKCRFLGNQDTLYPYGRHSRVYFEDCYIEGTTDFIFGWSTAYFNNCEIYSKVGGQYITAASTEESEDYGFVFNNCQLKGDAPKQSVYLGRPWRPFAKTVFINCTMDEHIKPEGWHNWNKPDAEKTSFYAEYKSKGKGADLAKRVKWSHQLTNVEYQEYSIEKVLRGWNPLDQLSYQP